MQEGFEAIRLAARDIQELNSRYSYSREIDDRVRTILELSEKLNAV